MQVLETHASVLLQSKQELFGKKQETFPNVVTRHRIVACLLAARSNFVHTG